MGSQCAPNNSPVIKFSVNATVREIWDENNVLANNINIGDTVSGTYAFNTTTADSDSSPNSGHFQHLPGSGEYGFDVSINNYNIKTDTNTGQFNIYMYDGQASYDSYSADEFGSQLPFINGSFIDYLSVYIGDPSGNSITSATLSNTPPVINSSGSNEFYMGGMRSTATGMSYFSVVATLNTIAEFNECTEPQDPVIISPGEGTFDRAQRFDAAIIMTSGLPALVEIYGTLNGMDIHPALSSCTPGAPNNQSRQTYVCPDFSSILVPGNNKLDINLQFSDGSILNQSVNWQLIGF